MNDEKRLLYKNLANKIRRDIIEMLHNAGSGHAGGSLSEVEILISLYYEVMNIDPKNPDMYERDRFILSKGHAAPGLYAVLANRGYFSMDELNNLRKMGSILQGHPCMDKTPGIDFSTGSLGHGLSAAIGMAMAMKLNGLDSRAYALLGDGEINEGQIWEAAMYASKMNLTNVVAILDYNGVQLDGLTKDIMPMEPMTDKWASFNWNVICVDGHDVASVTQGLQKSFECKDKPSIIIADTVKGKGISFMENDNKWHGKPINDNDYAKAISELKEV